MKRLELAESALERLKDDWEQFGQAELRLGDPTDPASGDHLNNHLRY